MEKTNSNAFLGTRMVSILAGTATMLVILAAYGQPAQAPKPRVYVFPFVRGEGVSDTVFQKVHQYFLTLFKMSTKLELLTDDDVSKAQKARKTEEKRKSTAMMAPWLETADNLLWSGKDYIEKKEYEKAIEALSKARKMYEANYLELRDYDKLVDATLQLATAFFYAGYKDNGEEMLKEILVWRPTLAVDRKRYPKEFIESLEQLKVLLEKRKGGTIRVESVPADGAKVFVDGLLKGTLKSGQSGVDIPGLYRGKHYLQVVKDGYAIWAKKIGVPPHGRTSKFVAKLDPLPEEKPTTSGEWEQLGFKTYEFALNGDFGVEFGKVAKQFATEVQVPYLLFGFVSSEPRGASLTLFLFKSEWSALAEVEPVSFDANLTNLQVNLLFLEANLASALEKFPKERVVRGTPAVYVKSREMKQAAAKAQVAAPPPQVAPPPPAVVEEKPPVIEPRIVEEPKAPVVVVKPEEKPEPVRVTPTVVEEQPELRSRTEPSPANEDLGELSSIFASSSDTGVKTSSTPFIPRAPEVEDDWRPHLQREGGIASKWWFWLGLTAGAALVGGGSYLLYDHISGSEATPKYSATVIWKPGGM